MKDLTPSPLAGLICCGVWMAAWLGCSKSPTGDARPEHFFDDPKVIALAAAAERGKINEIDRLLAEGVNVNAHGKKGMTPLLWALWASNKEGFNRLLEKGADPNWQMKNGESATSVAALAGDDSEWLKQVLKHGGNPNLVKGNTTRESPVYDAIKADSVNNVKLLIAAGANINYQNTMTDTPAIYAAGLGHFDIVYVLLTAGADYRTVPNYGRDLAYVTIRTRVDFGSSRDKVIDFLEKKGVDFGPVRKRVAEDERKYQEMFPPSGGN